MTPARAVMYRTRAARLRAIGGALLLLVAAAGDARTAALLLLAAVSLLYSGERCGRAARDVLTGPSSLRWTDRDEQYFAHPAVRAKYGRRD